VRYTRKNTVVYSREQIQRAVFDVADIVLDMESGADTFPRTFRRSNGEVYPHHYNGLDLNDAEFERPTRHIDPSDIILWPIGADGLPLRNGMDPGPDRIPVHQRTGAFLDMITRRGETGHGFHPARSSDTNILEKTVEYAPASPWGSLAYGSLPQRKRTERRGPEAGMTAAIVGWIPGLLAFLKSLSLLYPRLDR
jgi:hypothetical protein